MIIRKLPDSNQQDFARFNIQPDHRMVALDGALVGAARFVSDAERIADASPCSAENAPCYGDRGSLLFPTLSLFRNNREKGR